MTKTEIQIRFADVDILGHVNNVSLQHYFDLGKGTYFKKVLKLKPVWTKEGFIQAATNTSYMAQVYMEEQIVVETSVEKIGNKSITMYQRMINAETNELKSESRAVLVAFDVETKQSMPLPDKWRELINNYK